MKMKVRNTRTFRGSLVILLDPILSDMKRFLFIAFLLVSNALSAQLYVNLKSGTYEINEGSFLQISAKAPTYGIAFWSHPVLAEDKKALADLGVEISYYLPKNAFSVQIPAGITAKDLENAGVSAFTAWTPRMKLDAPIAQGDFPQWSILADGTIAVQFLAAKPFNNLPKFLSKTKDLGNLWYSGVLTVTKLEELAALPEVLFIQAIEEPGSPENSNSRSAARVAYTQRNGAFKGTNVVVGLGDDGDIGPHADYKGRLTSLAGNSLGDHGDHVAGTIFGAGNIDPDGAGSATEATMIYSSYPGNLTNTDLHYSQYGIRVTNSSYSNGCNAGYTAFAQQVDKDIIDNPALMHVFSAGNSNGSNCNYGAGSQWGNITGGHKQGKNVIATANLTSQDVIAGSSSRGPAADGRIKPDLAAVGTNVYSTIDPHTYGLKTGTSMSAPGVAGFFAILHNAHDVLQGDTATGGLLKAIAMNTADDLGNSGPDFIYGYGRINARRAIKTIQDTSWFIGSTSTGDTSTFDISIPSGAHELRAMVYWTDKEGSVAAASALVNNIDMQLTDLTNSNTYNPWVLNTAPNATTLNSLATRGIDALNNVEQVTLENPSAGDYRVSVYGTNIPNGPQEFYVVYYVEMKEIEIVYPATEAMEPGGTTVRWDGPTSGLNWEYSVDGGNSWTSITLNPISNRPLANWSVPNLPTDQAYLRVYTGNDTSTAGPFTILGQPNSLVVDWACPDSIKITINPVSSASAYTAYILGQSHMDSVYTASTNTMVIPYQPISNTWISASADINGAHGKRAYAIQLNAGTNGCPLPRDAGIDELISPQLVSSCQNPSLNVTVRIKNPSTQVLDTIPLAFEFNGTVARDTLFDAVPVYGDTVFTFTPKALWSGTISQSIKVWTELSGDMNALNDTLVENVDYLSSALYGLPFTQNFDTFNTCPQSTNCGGTVCALAGDWTNLNNGSQDNIDWRTNAGGTVSSGTGPSGGFGGSGRYLYLEASGNCEGQSAVLLSPCIDLSGTQAPELTFAYHMLGPSTGSLSVELFDGSIWTPLFSKTGNQSASWLVETIDLSGFIGDTVLLRVVGTTGNGYQSDIAIDQFEVEDQIGIPVANFASSTTTPCLNTAMQFQDLSTKTPTSWQWSITPNTYNFIGGTSATSQHPEVSFSAYGTYDVQLIASNSYGSDTLLRSAEIQVSPLPGLPIVETFHTASLSDFTIINPDGQATWAITDVDGPTGAKTGAAYMEYFNYSSVGEVDILQSPKFDITGYTQPTLMFDLSYAPYSSQYTDELAVLVSSDCGSSFDTVYYKLGADLGTTNASTSVFIPNGLIDWRTDTVDLSALNGSNFLMFQIMGICGYGNHLYIDNIRVIDLGGQSASATLDLPNSICEDQPFDFELVTSDTTLNGAFILNRSGSSLSNRFYGLGAHTATLSISRDYYLEYVYYDANTFVADSALLIPNAPLQAQYNLQLAGGLTYNFTDASTPTPTTWMWDFGDGATSTAQNPSHTYASPGAYQIKLVVNTACGLDSTVTTFNNIGVDEQGLEHILLYPNPTRDVLNISLLPSEDQISIRVLNMLGSELMNSRMNVTDGRALLHLEQLPSGMYQVEIQSNLRSSRSTVSKL